MKKYILITIILTLFYSVIVKAASPEPADLIFSPAGGGKFIYCNNEEGLERDNLADNSCGSPAYIMNNKGLEPDKYNLYISHVNYTSLKDSNGAATDKGFDVEVDAELFAEEDTVITINKTAFESPKVTRFYKDGQKMASEAEWGSLNACADMLGFPIYQLHSDIVYMSKEQTPTTITINKGERVWLSSFVDNYDVVPYLKPVHMQAEFEIVSGLLDVNVVCLKSTGILRDRSGFVENAAFGTYKRDRMQKGIADTLPEVNASLEYTIDDSVADGTMLPVKVYNQYVPDGNSVTEWRTNLNPQDDPWSKTISAESDMLGFRYYDPDKLKYYGKNVPGNKKDAVWVFDTKHSDTKAYDGDVTGYTADDYIPNYPLSIDRDNYGYGCSLGNYGVSTNYHLIINNDGKVDRYFYYNLKTTSNVIVSVEDENGNQLKPTVSKGYSAEVTKDTMASIFLPSGSETSFVIKVILPVNYYGGLSNSFEIQSEDAKLPLLNSEKLIIPEVKSVVDVSALLQNSNEETKKIFDGNINSYEVLKTDTGYIARWKMCDGAPNYYYGHWVLLNKVYFLDENFNLLTSYAFNSMPIEMSYSKGTVYVRTSRDGCFYSKDGQAWNGYYENNLPSDNGGIFGIKNKDGQIYVTTDNAEYYNVMYQDTMPKYIETLNDLYYYTDGNTIAISYDGIYWTKYLNDEGISSVEKSGNSLIVNGKAIFDIPSKEDNIYIKLNNNVLAFDKTPILENDRTLVPMRYIFEMLNMDVEWNEETKTATAKNGENTISFTIDSPIATVDGKEIEMDASPREYNWRTLIPVRFLSKNLGYTVNWDGEINMVSID